MSAGFPQVEGATPLSQDDLNGLKLASVLTQADLNAAEEANILAAIAWAKRSRRSDLLSRDYVLILHRRMFGDVWSWAGNWRRSETNIGVAPNSIPVRVEALLRDVDYWTQNHVFPPHEIAVRLHHQLVFIHPFPNGNGRHSRLMADLLLEQLRGKPFTWGGGNLSDPSAVRSAYIQSLRLADKGDVAALLAFATR